MNSSPKTLLEFITRLTYNIDGLSGELKLYLSQFLTFHFSKHFSISQIQDIENKRASNQFENVDDIKKIAEEITIEDKIWIIAIIHMLQSHADTLDDRINARKINQLSKELISLFDLAGKENVIEEERKRNELELHQFQNRRIIRIPAKIWPLALDYAIRMIVLLIFSYLEFDKDSIPVVNTFIISPFILILVYFVGKRLRANNEKMLSHYGETSQFKIEYHFSTSQYTWMAVLWGTGIFISYLLPDNFLHALAIVGLSTYYFLYIRFFRVGSIEENDLVSQLETKQVDTSLLNADENDELIVALETRLTSYTSRLEAYVLESALFGALSFSGFLQIMATDLVTFGDLETFASNIFITCQSFIHLDWPHFDGAITGLNNKVSLFCLVSVESLICSIFFLAVIASRLRFSNIADKVRTSLNLARAYNAKEEAFLEESEAAVKRPERLRDLTSKVNEQLHEANAILEEISPVMQYMEYFRNAGILVFLVILISSSLFITSVLGWTFLGLVFATYFYFNRTAINNQLMATFLNFRIRFIKSGYLLFALTFLPMVLAYILRIGFDLWQTEMLFVLSYILMGVYIFSWLILAAHVDEQFGEIENTNKINATKQSVWEFIKNIIAILILLLSVAIAFKRIHLEGANAMMMISLSFLSLLMFLVGYFLTKVRWLGILGGAVIGLASVSTLFKILHLYGASELRYIVMISITILISIVLWKRRLFHALFLRFCVATFLIALWFSPIVNRIPRRLDLAYEHMSFNNVGRMISITERDLTEIVSKEGEKGLDKRIQEGNWYLNQYGTEFGYTSVHRTFIADYEDFTNSVLYPENDENKIDTTLLPLALKATQQGIQIEKLFNYHDWSFVIYELQVDVLRVMGRKDDAIRVLEEIIQTDPPEELKESLQTKLAAIKSQGL